MIPPLIDTPYIENIVGLVKAKKKINFACINTSIVYLNLFNVSLNKLMFRVTKHIK